jgi:hypothetical protein
MIDIVRRIDGIVLAEADAVALIDVVLRAAKLWNDTEAALLAVKLAALTASGQPTSTPEPVTAIVDLGEWCEMTGTPERTARRHAAEGRLPGAVKAGNRWLVDVS